MNLSKVLIVNLTIIFSFLTLSVIIPRDFIYPFVILWRLAWLGWMFSVGERFSFTLSQWIQLGLLFLAGFLFSVLISPEVNKLYLIIAITLAPLTEELFFRGWLIKQLEGSKKRKIILSSLFFGVFHIKNVFLSQPLGQAYQLFYTTLIVGPLFAWIRLKYDSLFYTVSLHSVNNIIAETVTRKLLPILLGKSWK